MGITRGGVVRFGWKNNKHETRSRKEVSFHHRPPSFATSKAGLLGLPIDFRAPFLHALLSGYNPSVSFFFFVFFSTPSLWTMVLLGHFGGSAHPSGQSEVWWDVFACRHVLADKRIVPRFFFFFLSVFHSPSP